MDVIGPIDSGKKNSLKVLFNQKSLAGSVIQATGKVKFEDGFRMGVLPSFYF